MSGSYQFSGMKGRDFPGLQSVSAAQLDTYVARLPRQTKTPPAFFCCVLGCHFSRGADELRAVGEGLRTVLEGGGVAGGGGQRLFPGGLEAEAS